MKLHYIGVSFCPHQQSHKLTAIYHRSSRTNPSPPTNYAPRKTYRPTRDLHVTSMHHRYYMEWSARGDADNKEQLWRIHDHVQQNSRRTHPPGPTTRRRRTRSPSPLPPLPSPLTTIQTTPSTPTAAPKASAASSSATTPTRP